METLHKKSVRQQTTIVHAAITGLNDWSGNPESEDITIVLNKCFEIIVSVVSRYQGSVEEFSGEGITAVFGIPEFTEKTPINAVNAAIDIRNKITEVNDEMELPVPMDIKLGIQSGIVLVGRIGGNSVRRNTVLGETVTIASRICDIAENGQVLTGQEVYEKTKDKFEFLVLEPVPVKGKKKPLPLFEVKGRKKAPVNIGEKSSRMINSEMVGRKMEFEQLEKEIMQLINGRGSVVNIVGKAGIGKSRLMAEIRQSELSQRIAVFEGRAVSNGQNLSFHPIIQIIKSWAGIREEDSIEEAQRKLKSNINRIYPEAIDEIFPFIATMMGYRLEGKAKQRIEEIEGEALENLILKNLRDLLSKAASIRPVVIVIEDAHWCDVSSIIFMESLFKLVQKQRILFVNVFRPGHKETSEHIQKFVNENLKDHYQEINIEALTKDDSIKLIDNLIQKAELPNEINILVIERAAGNPFFIEEIIRSFIDEGLIEIKDDAFMLTENIRYANIPESIDNVLLSRIDRLDEKTKNLLRTASVIGRNFYYKVLEEAAQTIEEMDNKLEYLKDTQLISERKQKDEVGFLFKHALAQQATYDSIMEKTKKDLHLKIANSIEKVFAGRIHEFYGTLAHHYSKAGHQEKTEVYLINAGEESMKSGAFSEAVNFLKKALETHLQNTRNLPDRQKLVDLEEKLGFALYATGQFVEAVEKFDKVITFYYRSLPKSSIRKIIDMAYNVLLILKIIYFFKNKPESEPSNIERKLVNIIDQKAKALITFNPKRMFSETLYGFRFYSKHNFGNFEAAIMMSHSMAFFYTGILFKLGKKLMEFAAKIIDERNKIGWLYGEIAKCVYVYYGGRKLENINEEKINELGVQIGEYWPITTFYFHGGLNYIESGNRMLFLHYLQRLMGVSEIFDNSYSLVQYHRLNVFYNLKFRKIKEALEISKRAINIARKTDHTLVLFMIYCFRSMAFSFLNDYTSSRNSLTDAEKLLKDTRISVYIITYLLAKTYCEIDELKKNPSSKGVKAPVLKTTKDLIANSKNIRKNLPEAFRLQAIAFWLLHKPNNALLGFEKSIKAGLDYDCNLELSRTYFEAGKFLRDPKNKKERISGMNGTECLSKAKLMFEDMSLEWDLKEYEKYMEII